ncbi:dehydrogenase E1 component [Granulicella tundricola MP5ACTX9]|uniref:Dehydrogenase E1 component n=2 Tax=Granulicella TaxID=940557 RepID=E8WVG0_GRATM|nr:dehydrogenase E1 component [Granulicella tundricola MP5ACTX9]
MCAKSFENPLTPHKRLREIYAAMVETRVLGKRLRKGFAQGTEACWVGTAIGLIDAEGDVVSAGKTGALVDYVVGAKLKAVLKDQTSEAKTPAERLYFALGAASRMAAEGKVLLAFVLAGDLPAVEWKRIFSEALRLELPIVFVVVPEKRSEPGLADVALKLGLPGIPVDASDAVAMYRVAQESIGRARAGGGPALIEGVVFPATGDPIALLGRQLIAKGAATQAWIDKVEPRFRTKLPKETVH